MAQSEGEAFAGALSMISGWAYFMLWSISFYPQVFKNFKQKTTQGLSPDFPVANILGLSCYTVYASGLLYSPVIRAQYSNRHHGHFPTVQHNDAVYGAHAVCLEIIILSQYWPKLWRFRPDAWQRPSAAMMAFCSACIIYLLSNIYLAGTSPHPDSPTQNARTWLDVIYAFGNIKVLLTVIKYAPQAHYFYKRKSTVGFAMSAVYMDLVGSVLSLIQLVIDSALQNDWSGVTGNPAKFALGNVSLLFSITYLTQHHVLYREARIKAKSLDTEGSETEPLLRDAEQRGS